MTDQLITPPPELVQLWINEYAINKPGLPEQVYLASRAARWGADQELRACVDQLYEWKIAGHELVAARRGSATLKKNALETYDKLQHLFAGYGNDGPLIRYALEQLDD
jgi:hypothetical protein